MKTLLSLRNCSLIVLSSLGLVAALIVGAEPREPAGAPKVTVSDRPIDRNARVSVSYAPVVKRVAPSVVNIYSTRVVRLFRHPFFGDQFGFDNGRPRSRKSEGLGSGVIVSPDGYILTANHLVDGADEIKVGIADGKKEFTAKVVGTDPATDVAVLKVDANDLPAITLADSDKLEVGDLVLAIGNPFDVGQTVTMGIVSALGRGSGINEDFIQTDAAINPGNSGGALVDIEGRLIGINTAIVSSSGGSQGIGFAVPINMARRVMERIITGGKVTHGYLGVLPQDLTPRLARSFNVPDQSGALVGNVFTNSAAEKAGIKPGDVIIELNGKKVADPHGLQLLVSQLAPGSKVTVKFLRKGQEKSVTATLGELKEGESLSGQSGSDTGKQSASDALDGVTVSDLDNSMRRQLDIPPDVRGAIVTDLDPDSNSAEAGLQIQDVIVEINEQPVRNADQAVELCNKAKGDEILLQVWRHGKQVSGTLFLSVNNTKKK